MWTKARCPKGMAEKKSIQARIDEDKAIADDASGFVSKGEFWNMREYRTADYRVVNQARSRMTAEQKRSGGTSRSSRSSKVEGQGPGRQGRRNGLEAAIKRRRGNIDSLMGIP